MKKGRLLMMTVVLVLLPVQALAAVCFQTTDSIPGVVVVALLGQVETLGSRTTVPPLSAFTGFFGLLGEFINPCGGGGVGQSTPVIGTAHLRSDQKAHLMIYVGPTNICGASVYEVILDPPSYSSGTGTQEIMAAGFRRSVNFVAAPSCPPVLPR